MWRPAGMSSDEDFSDADLDDCYFSTVTPPKETKAKSVLDLLPPDININIRNKLQEVDKVVLFHRATEECDVHAMHTLIKQGVKVDDSRPNDWTPLLKACSRGNFEIVDFLLINGANPNLSKELYTPLMACCMSSYAPEEDKIRCIRSLISYGANVNAADKYRLTALMHAVINNLEEIVSELLTIENIDVNRQDKDGWTALFHAVIANNKNITEKLINAGISIDTTNIHNEYTAYQLAELKNYKDLAKIINNEYYTSNNEVEQILVPKDPLKAFFEELPNNEGKGGYSSEVRNIFSGLGLEGLYDKLNINISFPDFLVMKDLSKLGIILEPVRQKLLVKGIHRYHLCPWMETSLHHINHDIELSVDDCINIMSNVTKHLCILYSTLHYIKMRIPETTKKDLLHNKELLKILSDNFSEIHNIKMLLRNVLYLAEKVKIIGDYEADYIGKSTDSESKRKHKYLWFVAGSLTLAGTIFYYKYH